MATVSEYLLPILQIIWIDLLLSGDNAVVIALACRSLPPHQRKLGMLLGAGTAVGLRIIFAMIITLILQVPFLKVVGGLLLLWIGVKLAVGEEEGEAAIESSDNLWRAVRTIAIADAVMSLDNVIAIAGAAGGNVWLFIFGLALSIPLLIYGSAMLTRLFERVPLFIWFGAGLLGWIAGEMIVADSFIVQQLQALNAAWVHLVAQADGHGGPAQMVLHPIDAIAYGAASVGAIIVLAIGYMLKKRAAHTEG